VKKTEPFPTFAEKSRSARHSMSQSHLHKLSEFPYAGQIFKSSFNSFLPHRPLIQSKKEEIGKSLKENSFDLSRFLTKFSTQDSEIEEIENVGEVMVMVEEFVKVFKEKWEKKDKKTLSEALIDFMCEDQQWFLIKVKFFKMDYLPSKVIKDPLLSPQLLRRSIVNPELIDMIFNGSTGKKFKFAGLTQGNLMQRLNKIESKSKLMKSSGLRYIDMKGILESNIRNYERQSPCVLNFPQSFNRGAVYSVDEALRKYDEFRKNLKSSFK
jgi:hypothetical protein